MLRQRSRTRSGQHPRIVPHNTTSQAMPRNRNRQSAALARRMLDCVQFASFITSTRKYHALIHVANACSLLLRACAIKSASTTANKFDLSNRSDMSQPISSTMTNILLLLFFLRIATANVRPEVNRELLDFIRHCDLYIPISQTFMSFLPRGIRVDFVEGRVTVDGGQVAPGVVPRILHCLHLIPGTLGVAHVQIGMLSITGEMALYAMEFLHLHEATLHTIELVGCVFDKSALEVSALLDWRRCAR